MKIVPVLIVSGEPLLRLGLRYFLTVEAGLPLCGETCDGAVALRYFEQEERPGLVVLDLRLPHGDGFVLLRDIRRRVPGVPVLIVSSLDEPGIVQRAFRAGASAYVTTYDGTPELLAAVAAIRQGVLYASRRLSDGLLIDMAKAGKSRAGVAKLISHLSDRELQVFRLIGHGNGVSEIAKQLGVSVKTIDTHCQRMKEKLKVDSAVQLRKKATRWIFMAESRRRV